LSWVLGIETIDVFVAVFIVLAITASIGRSEKEEVERVVEILKRAKRIKEEIERRGENLTREYDMMLWRKK